MKVVKCENIGQTVVYSKISELVDLTVMLELAIFAIIVTMFIYIIK